MTNVAQLVRRVDDKLASSEELLMLAIAHIVALTKHVADQAARIADLEARTPAPRFEVPKNWITIKRASGLCGSAPPTLYRWVRTGRIVGAPYGGRVYVDPTTLPKRSEII